MAVDGDKLHAFVNKAIGDIGATRDPRRYRTPGDEVVSMIEGIGTLRNRCIAPN